MILLNITEYWILGFDTELYDSCENKGLKSFSMTLLKFSFQFRVVNRPGTTYLSMQVNENIKIVILHDMNPYINFYRN